MRVENSSGSLLTRYRIKFREFLGEAYTAPPAATPRLTIWSGQGQNQQYCLHLLTSLWTHVGRNSSPPPHITNRTTAAPHFPPVARGAARRTGSPGAYGVGRRAA